MTLDAALHAAASAGAGRRDAQVIAAHVLGVSRTWVLTHGETVLTAEQASALSALLTRCAAGEPCAYLVGRREFYGLSLDVTPAVLIPRPDTETLVDWAVELLNLKPPQANEPGPAVLDLGTGSGAIALAIRHTCPSARVCASDASGAALEIARQNAAQLGLPIEFLEGPWWEPVTGRVFDLVVSNPPYIAAQDPHLPALQYEPQSALVSGFDGLADLRSIIASATPHLRPGAWLLLEHGWDQHRAVADLLLKTGFSSLNHRSDLAGHIRCTGAQWPG